MDEQWLIKTLFAAEYQISSEEQVRYRLRHLADSHAQLSVYSQRSVLLHTTSVLAVGNPHSKIVLDGFARSDHGTPRTDEDYTLIGRDLGVYVGLRGKICPPSRETCDGELWFDYGGKVWVYQRRRYYRVDLPPKEQTPIRLTDGSGSTFELSLIDLSVGGCGALVSANDVAVASLPKPGDKLLKVQFTLPGEEPLLCVGTIANVRRWSAPKAVHYVLGIEFESLSTQSEQLILRYLRQRERVMRRRQRGF